MRKNGKKNSTSFQTLDDALSVNWVESEVISPYDPTMQLADPAMLRYYSGLQKRELLISGEFDSATLDEVAYWIRRWNVEDEEAGRHDEPSQTITIFVNSEGGDVYPAQTLFNIMRCSSTKIRVVVTGLCASAAIWVLLGATDGERYAYPHSTFMMHDGFVSTSNSLYKAKDAMDYIQTTDDLYWDAIQGRSNYTESDISAHRRSEWYMGGEEAEQSGLIDHLITNAEDARRWGL